MRTTHQSKWRADRWNARVVINVPDDERAIHAASSILRQLPTTVLISLFRSHVERSALRPIAVWEGE